MKKLIVGLVLVMLLMPVSCAKAPAPAPMPTPAPTPAPAPPPRIAVPAPSITVPPPSVSPAAEERMIVRTGEMFLVVEDVVDAKDEIARLAVKLGGYVVSSQISGKENERQGVISIRVPNDKFEQTLAELTNLAVRVTMERTSSKDVTEEYVDLKSRLKNAEATERQYLALLEKAKEIKDILSIYEALSRVRSEIEQIKGRMQLLERTVAMSLITVRLEPAATAKPLVRAGWSALEALKSAVRGLVIAGQTIVAIAIGLIIFSPIWGAILGIIYWRRRRKRAIAK